jgi:hypothetical protein
VDKIPEVKGRICKHKGVPALEVSCPYCGTLHYHSREPVPGVRSSHCGIPYLCQKGEYLITEIYEGPPQPKKQPQNWLNCRGEQVKRMRF